MQRKTFGSYHSLRVATPALGPTNVRESEVPTPTPHPCKMATGVDGFTSRLVLGSPTGTPTPGPPVLQRPFPVEGTPVDLGTVRTGVTGRPGPSVPSPWRRRCGRMSLPTRPPRTGPVPGPLCMPPSRPDTTPKSPPEEGTTPWDAHRSSSGPKTRGETSPICRTGGLCRVPGDPDSWCPRWTRSHWFESLWFDCPT